VNRLSSRLLILASILLGVCSPGGEVLAQTKQLRVGVLMTHGDDVATWFPSVLLILKQHGWVDGQNVAFEYRAGHSEWPRIVRGAGDLVRGNVDVILTVGPPAARAAFDATRTIPIVAHDYESDPVSAGYAESYNHPGRNLTGMFLDTQELATKWLELLKDVQPGLSRVVVLVDPSSPPAHLDAVKSVAPTVGIQLQVIEVRQAKDIDKAALSFGGHPQALMVLPSPLMFVLSPEVANLATKQRLPGVSMFWRFAESGGLIAYGPAEAEDQFAILIVKVLNGSKPAGIPIERPAKFMLKVNLKTARAIGITMPESVLIRADQSIR